MKWLTILKVLFLRLYRKVIGMAEFVIIVQEEYEIDEHGNEIPGTRKKLYCVKNDITNEIVQCFPDLESAIELCKEKNNPRPKPKF